MQRLAPVSKRRMGNSFPCASALSRVASAQSVDSLARCELERDRERQP